MTDFEPVTLFVRGDENSSDEDAWDDTILVQQYDKSVNQLKQEVAKMMGINDSGGDSGSSKDKVNSNCKNRSKRYRKKPEHKWEVGSFCRAKYSEDQKFYEATILSIHENKGTCTVQYIGYENQEEVYMDSLVPSGGRFARKAQEEEAMNEHLQEIEDTKQLEQSDSCSAKEEWKKSRKKFGMANVGRRHLRRMHGSPDIRPSSSQSTRPQEHHLSGWPSHVPPPPPHLFEHFSNDDGEALSAMLMSWYMSGYHTGYYYGLKQAKSQHNMDDGNRHYGRSRKN